MEEARELKRELLRCKQEMRNLQAVKDAQQQRLSSQEASILQMKQELLRAGMTADELNNHNAELQWKLEDCNKMWGECKKEAGQKDRLLQQLKHKRENELQRELERNNISQIPTSTEHNGHSYPGSPAPPMSDAEEVQLLRDSLRSLRNDFRDHDPQHHTLDTLEQGIVSLIDRLHLLHTQRVPAATWKREISKTQRPTRGPRHLAVHRLGEISLRDVKAAVDREGNYRYHFKALDPEFGTVKEEVFLDGAIIPGWEGKIVAWVEEDRGEER
ncbi:Dixin-A [Liparis tanakae]|uniref:Dixin-A n=1 Tax=Liparis tanakae TaxID=230148 RepID=A0A4Z2IFJ4_9TELE|nr:Dixin-A [Liparis tanakae]